MCVAVGFVAAPPVSIAVPLRGQGWRIGWACVLIAALAVGALFAPRQPRLAEDEFATLATQLRGAPGGPLISAAPDAYGVLLPRRPELSLRPGARGLILLDGAQRAYDPGLTARGVVVARLSPGAGFERPNGSLDDGPAVLVQGVVTRAG